MTRKASGVSYLEVKIRDGVTCLVANDCRCRTFVRSYFRRVEHDRESNPPMVIHAGGTAAHVVASVYRSSSSSSGISQLWDQGFSRGPS